MKPIDKIYFDILTANMSNGRTAHFLVLVQRWSAQMRRLCSALRGYVFTVLVKSPVVGWARGPGLAAAV